MLKKSISIILIVAVLATGVLLFTNVLEPGANAATLKQGMTGSSVKEVQTKLISWGYLKGSADGIFGKKTTTAVKAFQKKNKLTADGVVGKATAKAMGLSSGGNSGSTSSSNNNVYLLAKCVYAEARGEPYVGQVAIAATVLNRVRSSSFPNTIAGVIYQPYAFTAVDDGQINLTPNDSAMRAAKDALSGWDPTNGCLFYYNPRTATNAWIKKKEIHLTIGKHVFCL